MQLLKRAALAAAFVGTTGTVQALEFTIRIENLGPQPLSPVFLAAGNGDFDIFTAGTAASAEIEAIAEGGDTAPMVAFAETQVLAGNVLDFKVAGVAPIMPGNSETITLEATEDFRWLSFASMLGITNDGFIGSAIGENDFEIDLFNNGIPRSADFTVSFLNVWDAGTEENTEAEADIGAFGGMGSPADSIMFIRAPHTGIRGDGIIDSSLDWYGFDVARVEITPVPEPATMLAFTPALLFLRRKKVRR